MIGLISRLFKSVSANQGEVSKETEGDLSERIAALLSLVPSAIAEGDLAVESLIQALYESGIEALQVGSPGQAAAALAQAQCLGCKEPYLNYNLALSYSRSGQSRKAHASFSKAFLGSLNDEKGDGYYLRNLHALEGVSLQQLCDETGIWASRYSKGIMPFRHNNKTREVRTKLRVGLLSGRFCRHAVGFLTLGGLEKVDSSKIDFLLYANASPEDDYTDRFKTIAAQWHDITDLDDNAAAALIFEDDLDILIDMAGHSAGSRMGVIMRKPASVQAKWAGGQHGTTGVAALDYFITDGIETPEEHDPYFYEKPIRLPNAYACYTPPPDAPEVAQLPALKNGYLTFGCFNNIAKLTDATISTWAEILNQLPTSHLILKHTALSEQITRDRVASQFSSYDISPLRLDLRIPTDQQAHLAAYADIDIALDPFPWSGCVTTCESLWMGVPVLTLLGNAFCHRHSASFLTTVGLENWIAGEQKEYLEKAIEFARNMTPLSELRTGLRAKVMQSPLCDTSQFGKDFETVLFRMADARSSV